MKKFLFVAVTALFLSAAVQAQSTQKSDESTPAATTIVAAEKVTSADADAPQAVTESGGMKKSCGSEAKAGCCSSKKAQKAAKAAGCCADGSKKDAACNHAKADAKPLHEE